MPVRDEPGSPPSLGDDSPGPKDSATPVDFAFLAAQTFDDRDLQLEVLGLFVAQARRVVPGLPALSPKDQADAAHLLKGSARGIGAWCAAAAAEAYEKAVPDAREPLYHALETAFAAANAVIVAEIEGAAEPNEG